MKNFHQQPSLLRQAGGGIAAGLCAFAEPTIVSGIDTLDLIDSWQRKVAGADLVYRWRKVDWTVKALLKKAPVVYKRTFPEGSFSYQPYLTFFPSLPPTIQYTSCLFPFRKVNLWKTVWKLRSLYLEHTATCIGRFIKYEINVNHFQIDFKTSFLLWSERSKSDIALVCRQVHFDVARWQGQGRWYDRLKQ